MSNRNKRKQEWDPLKSDSDDLDYGAESSPKPRAAGRSRKSKNGNNRKPAKRRRERYGGGSDDEIIDDTDEISEEDDFSASSEEEDIERNPRTGRGVRSVAKKPVKYEESEEGSIINESEADDNEDERPPSRPRRSLVVKLKVPTDAITSRTRPGSRASRRGITPQASNFTRTRRSSRISNDDREPLVALTNSGNHEVVTRAGTATPEPTTRTRPTYSGKGLKKPPSAIMEASQEDSQTRSLPAGEDMLSQLQASVADGEELLNVQDTQEDVPSDIPARDVQMGEAEDEHIVQESANEDEDDEDDGPVARGGRTLRQRRKASTPPVSAPAQDSRRSLRPRKGGVEQSSDFEPDPEGDGDAEEDISESDVAQKSARGRSSNDDSQSGRRSGRLTRTANSGRSRSARQPSEDEELDPDEIADEAAELDEDARRNRRPRRRPATRSEISFEPNLRQRSKKPDYRIMRPELLLPIEDDDAPAAVTPQRNRRGGAGGAYRSLFSTFGPFGGTGGLPPIFGAGENPVAGGAADSDSSDDETRGGQQGVGGALGMTPTSAFPKTLLPQAHNNDPIQGPGGGPPGLGKIKDKKALADADPLGVDPNVSFDGVGGLDDHIDRLKEMVALPLLYPELFQRFHVTPPRGVLFHGPPGTGKTLLARALASSVSSHGKKVTFYMRKGADALSKWVGEAEKQLRLLFEEARKNQPSIIFFDEIDGLAPVRSSKQEQIHASIVATLLALMDGMDGRGQVIVIGATNRPDSVDPALRRPGRFDREFYFALPDQKARRAIIDIHTKGWEPPLEPRFKDSLAEITRGYGGADLRALCTEAALNAVQGTYPQIYKSNQKLIIDPQTIKVLAKDFMISVNKIVPSSERSAASGASPLKKDVEPLLRLPLAQLTQLLDDAIPRKKHTTALEEAMYDDREDAKGFERETMQRQFESARVFRPRLLIRGQSGMGQGYLGAALLSKLEGLHVQNFDMATLLKDSSRSPEAAIVQQFEEVKRHKPSVIYLPNIDTWYHTLGESAIRTFTGLLRSLPPTEPVLVLGIMDRNPDPKDDTDAQMLRDLFGYSIKNQYEVIRPGPNARREYFQPILDLVNTSPADFPDPAQRKKRELPELPVAPVEVAPTGGPSKADLKAQKKKDRHTLNMLKLLIQNVMDQIKLKYKKFRFPVIDEGLISYLYDEQDPNMLTTDLNEEERQRQQLFRPYELDKDAKGVPGLREVATGKFYYNLEIVTIEKRLSNGYYKRPKDFLADIKRLAKDAKTINDQERLLKGNEMLANVEVDMTAIEQQHQALVAECEAVFHREQQREQEILGRARPGASQGAGTSGLEIDVPPPGSKTTIESSGPVVLGQQIPGGKLFTNVPNAAQPESWSLSNGSNPSHLTNGSSAPSKPDEDVDMPDSQGDNQADASTVRHQGSMGSTVANASYVAAQGPARSQRSAHTLLAHGSQVEQYQNSASTTTSGQKTSDKSNRSSGPYSLHTPASNGQRVGGGGPDFSDLGPAIGGSQLPDTQEQLPDASSQSQASPTMAPPAAPHARQTSISALLNDTNGDHGVTANHPPDDRFLTGSVHMIVDATAMSALHDDLTEKSSGMNVEQLMQVHSELMNVIWAHRAQYNRNVLIYALQTAFNATVEDIEQMQTILDPSQRQR